MKHRNKSVHFIGIGGISMSALAAYLLHEGCTVAGSDLVGNAQTDCLRLLGAKIYIGHNAGNIGNANLVVISGAIESGNPELVEASRRGIEIISREQLLADIESGFPTRIAVAGTHGKSTTVAMTSAILCEGGLNPTVHNGAVIKAVGSNLILGGNEIFLTEACEFKRSFLKLSPTVAVITNVDADHLDCYRDIDEIQEAFEQFTSKAAVKISVNKLQCSVRMPDKVFSLEAESAEEYEKGKFSFKLKVQNPKLKTTYINIKLGVVGHHNIYNALAAIAVGLYFGVEHETISNALYNFKGIERRFEVLDSDSSFQLISDYAHHPAELETTIATAKSLYQNPLIVFQPHTYTRTLALFDQFVEVLSHMDTVVYKTYAAREKPIEGGTAYDLFVELGKRGRCLGYFENVGSLKAFLNKTGESYDAVILTGAGDLTGHYKE